MAIVGPKTRAALRKFEENDLVEDIRVFHDRVRVAFVDGLVEHWDLDGQRKHGLRLPRSGLWGREPFDVPEYNSHCILDDDYDPALDPLFEYTKRGVRKAGWLDRRLLVHDVTARLLGEGYLRPEFPRRALEADLDAVRFDAQQYALSTGCVRGQAGRPISKPPPGFLLCLDALDWGPLATVGRPTLIEAWQDPQRLRWAVEGIVRRGQAITRAGVIRRLVCGRAEGHPRKAGVRWTPPGYWIDVLRTVLGQDDGVIVVDPEPGCGSKAIAVAALGGVFACPSDVAVSRDSLLWEAHAGSRSQAEIIEDDDICAHVALVECDGFDDFAEAVAEYGCRCEQVVTRLPWSDRERVVEMPGARVVRLRSRPYLGDEVIAIWSQG